MHDHSVLHEARRACEESRRWLEARRKQAQADAAVLVPARHAVDQSQAMLAQRGALLPHATAKAYTCRHSNVDVPLGAVDVHPLDVLRPQLVEFVAAAHAQRQLATPPCREHAPR